MSISINLCLTHSTSSWIIFQLIKFDNISYHSQYDSGYKQSNSKFFFVCIYLCAMPIGVFYIYRSNAFESFVHLESLILSIYLLAFHSINIHLAIEIEKFTNVNFQHFSFGEWSICICVLPISIHWYWVQLTSHIQIESINLN